MSGLSIQCGTFHGHDKSGSALSGVLKKLSDISQEVAKSIDSQFENAEYALISVRHAKVLLPDLVFFRYVLLDQIGHDDWWKKAMDEEASGLDPVRAKWGSGLGWQLYCVNDLIRACEISQDENCEIVICLC
jgi:hypothetical protein